MSEPKGRTQIPIVCPGHTRPLAELQYLYLTAGQEKRTLLLSACHDKMPMLRDGTSGDWIGTFSGHKGAAWSCQMDPSGNLVATASGDFSVRVWDGISGQSLVELPHKHIVKTCSFSPDSLFLATGGKESLLRVYDLNTLLNAQGGGAGDKKEPMLQVPQEAPITKVAFLPNDPTMILCACANGMVYLWQNSTLVHTFDTTADGGGKAEEIRDLEVTTVQNQNILTVATGVHVVFYNIATRQLLKRWKMPVHFRDEGGATLHPLGHKFVAGGSDLWVRVFDFESGQELECHKGHHGPIRCVRYSPDGTLYATGSEDGTIRLWKTEIPNQADQ